MESDLMFEFFKRLFSKNKNEIETCNSEIGILDIRNNYIYTIDGNTIAILRTTLPQFIKYKTEEIYQSGSTGEKYSVDTGNVKQSLDFGLPKEIYIDGLNYSEDTTIYNNYWKNFYNDQFNVNTKKVTCYVNLYD